MNATSTAPNIRIALADDHAILRTGLAGLLNSMEGMEIVVEADNGRQLLDKMEQQAALPDVCILDINMPVMNGYETATAITEKFPKTKILALSMYDSEFNIIKMLRAGANGYMLKNIDAAEMRRAITDVHTHGFYHSELVTGRMLRMLHDRKSMLTELSATEQRFLALCCSELTYKEIAAEMNKSPRTIDGYREELFTRLQIASRTGLVLFALKAGIAPL